LNYVKSDATLTLALPKTGLLPEISGELFLAEIGIPLDVYKHLNIYNIPPLW